MRTVTINIADIGGTAHPGDHVIFRSPVTRPRPDGAIVSTGPTTVYLTNGRAQVDLTEGPLSVTFRCRTITDSGPFDLHLDAGDSPITLATLMDGAYTAAPNDPTAYKRYTDARIDELRTELINLGVI